MVEHLAEMIIPEDETPGAKQAGVAEFIDFMVANRVAVSTSRDIRSTDDAIEAGNEAQNRFLAGLELDERAESLRVHARFHGLHARTTEQSARGTCLQSQIHAHHGKRARFFSDDARLHRCRLLHDQNWIGEPWLSRTTRGVAKHARLSAS